MQIKTTYEWKNPEKEENRNIYSEKDWQKYKMEIDQDFWNFFFKARMSKL